MAGRDVPGMKVLELLMDPSQAQLGRLAPLEAIGQRSIMVLDPSPIPMSSPSVLSYFRGAVRSGTLNNRQGACKATIFKFNELDSASELYEKLTQVDHPCVMKALGIANGVGEHINNTFLALLPFDTTFATYIIKNGPGADENGRFTINFIIMISDIIDALEELHNLGYYCPDLKGDDIAVIKQSGSISAKIWKYSKCDAGMEEKQKDDDWFRLGCLIVSVGWTKEAMNLLKKIKSGQLKGKSIMKHSALLTVRKKFENVLAFYVHISLNYPEKHAQSQNNNILKVSELCVANLENDLDRILSWTIPEWTHARRGLPISTKTLRGFVNQLRIFIEHEIFFIPEEMSRPLTINEKRDYKKVKDLEHHLQDSCGVIHRAVQRLVAELNLEL